MSDSYQGVSESFLDQITKRIGRLKIITQANGVNFPKELQETLQNLAQKKKKTQDLSIPNQCSDQLESLCDISIQSSANDIQSQVQTMKAKTNQMRDLLTEKLLALKQANSSNFQQKNRCYQSEISAMKQSMTVLIDQTRNTQKQIDQLKNYTLNLEKDTQISRNFQLGVFEQDKVSFGEVYVMKKIQSMQQDMNTVMEKVQESIQALNEQNTQNQKLKESIRQLQIVLEEEELNDSLKESACQCLIF